MKKVLICVYIIALISLSACSDTNQDTSSLLYDVSTTESEAVLSKAQYEDIPEEYKKILNTVISSYPWFSVDQMTFPEDLQLSDMFRHHKELSEIKFALFDLDKNGQNELFISAGHNDVIYDMFTLEDGKAKHIFSSQDRGTYVLYKTGYIGQSWSAAASCTGHDYYLMHNGIFEFKERITLDLFYAKDIGLIKSFDEVTHKDSYYFSTKIKSEDDSTNGYERISDKTAHDKIKFYQNNGEPMKIDYVKLSEYQGAQE